MFHLSTQNIIKAFKFRAEAIFNLLEKTHPWFTKFDLEKFFPFFYIISTQRSYIHRKLDTNSCFANLRAISNLCSFFFIHPVLDRSVKNRHFETELNMSLEHSILGVWNCARPYKCMG
jgi:uncharacterized protein YcsI (UPF0317 family)